MTILAVILLLSFAFSERMRHKILGPMERIVKILEQLIQDPMAFASDHPLGRREEKEEAEAQEHRNEFAVEKTVVRVGLLPPPPPHPPTHTHTYTHTHTHTHTQVGHMLHLALGEAGAKIISKHVTAAGKMEMDKGGEVSRGGEEGRC